MYNPYATIHLSYELLRVDAYSVGSLAHSLGTTHHWKTKPVFTLAAAPQSLVLAHVTREFRGKGSSVGS